MYMQYLKCFLSLTSLEIHKHPETKMSKNEFRQYQKVNILQFNKIYIHLSLIRMFNAIGTTKINNCLTKTREIEN